MAELPTTIETRLGRVEYVDTERGEPILYFHGTGATGDIMLPVESSLVDEGFRLIIPNRPGYGATPLGNHRTAADCADVAAGLLDALGISATHVMGSSGGGAFATAFANRHPSRARSLTLLCPQLHRWNEKQWLPESSKWTLPFLKRRLLRKLLLKAYRFQFPRMPIKQFLKIEAGRRFGDVVDDPATMRLCDFTFTAMKSGIQHPGFENDMIVFASEEVIGDNHHVNCPVAIIHDAYDPLAPVAHVNWFETLVPNCERITVHAGGHLVWVGPDAAKMQEARLQFLRAHSPDFTTQADES